MALRQYRSIALVVPFLLLGGCGGCDSCFSTAEPHDAMPMTSPHALATAVAEAAVAMPEPDAGMEASSDAAVSNKDATAIPIPTVARPKAPMPLGAFQTCGKYDAPLCENAFRRCQQRGAEIAVVIAAGHLDAG